MTVREKGRIQGFPDHFVFKGTVHQQYKQIANAVSPQLTKALTRELLCSLLEGVTNRAGGNGGDCNGGGARKNVGAFKTKKDAGAVVYSPSLQNFRDFIDTFEEASLAGMTRHAPVAVTTPKLVPMTYPEFITAGIVYGCVQVIVELSWTHT
jgi:hypothetical protein